MTKEIPYVVSEDVTEMLKRYQIINKNISFPTTAFLQSMLRELEAKLSQYFPTEVIEAIKLQEWIKAQIKSSRHPVVSLDRAYVDEDQPDVAFLDVTRAVDSKLQDIGLIGRLGKSIAEQINTLAKEYAGQTIALVDDVIYEGKTLLNIIKQLQDQGISIEIVYAGVSIKRGKQLIEDEGIKVASFREFERVIDEVCERDFCLGVPNSGRTVVKNDKIIGGAPYFLPFGKPDQWASIPEYETVDFSWFLLQQALLFWSEVEKKSGQSIPTNALPRKVYGLLNNPSVTEAIKEILKKTNE